MQRKGWSKSRFFVVSLLQNDKNVVTLSVSEESVLNMYSYVGESALLHLRFRNPGNVQVSFRGNSG